MQVIKMVWRKHVDWYQSEREATRIGPCGRT